MQHMTQASTPIGWRADGRPKYSVDSCDMRRLSACTTNRQLHSLGAAQKQQSVSRTWSVRRKMGGKIIEDETSLEDNFANFGPESSGLGGDIWKL